MIIPVIEADKTKTDKDGSACSSDVGVRPGKSKGFGRRKRSFHRALKRGDPDAIRENQFRISILRSIDALKRVYRPRMLEEAYAANLAFMGVIK